MQTDHVDRILQQWQHERPELDPLAMSIFGRLWRLNAIASKAVEQVHLEFGLSQPEFDVLATLRRSGEPYMLSPTALYTSLMLSSGAMTNRLDKLEARGLIYREPSPEDRRSMLVALTTAGLARINETMTAHVANEQRLLCSLNSIQQQALADLLRTLLLDMGNDQTDPVDPE
jgi:DNA-binding MarR family transcriptional regulator